ncbi:MAG: hypothetical protein RLY85_2109 [Bacteroidota bacterium]|jgi:lysophospholipase L1-like esterase
MKPVFGLLILFFMYSPATAQDSILSFLALGDSYTIGESVPVYENFPYQAVQMLRQKGIRVHAPEIVAKTGWTTDELMNGIDKTILNEKYDIVTLLIGVNNQYRGRSAEAYQIDFEKLLLRAIDFAGGQKNRVHVLSIPDWGATPFAEGRDRQKIAAEIDQFNAINRQITLAHGISYIDITPGTREVPKDNELVARDKLHPSGKDYRRWSEALVGAIIKTL